MESPGKCFLEDSDCEKAMEDLVEYEIKIVAGFIVQVYYRFTYYNEIAIMDEEINKIAKLCNGESTREAGIIYPRRDVDFEFPTTDVAHMFCEKLRHETKKFFLHQKLNSMGLLTEKPTLQQLYDKKEKLKQINCQE